MANSRRRVKEASKKGLFGLQTNVVIYGGLGVVVAVAIIVYAAFLGGEGGFLQSSAEEEKAETGIEAFQRGDFSKAINQLEKDVEADPDDAQNLRILGLSYEATGKLGKAVDNYEASLEIDPKQPEVLYSLASINKQAGKIDKAIGQLDEALEINPTFFAAKLFLGDLYLIQKDTAKAKALYQEIIDAKPFGNVDDKALEKMKAL